MNIRQLSIFQKVAQNQSITKTAKELYISQPAVSLAIKELEAKVGVSLFDRLSGKIYLNERGSILLAKVNNLLSLYDEIVASPLSEYANTPIKIGSSITIANELLIGLIKDFKQVYPNKQVNLVIKNARDIETMVNNNELDLGLIEGVIANEALASELISEYDLCFITAYNSKLSQHQSISIRDIIQEDFLLREEGSAIREIFDSVLRINDLHIEPVWTSINSQVLIKAVINGIGISILPRTLINDYLTNKQLSIINVKDAELVNNNYVIYNRGKQFDQELAEFKDFIIKYSSVK